MLEDHTDTDTDTQTHKTRARAHTHTHTNTHIGIPDIVCIERNSGMLEAASPCARCVASNARVVASHCNRTGPYWHQNRDFGGFDVGLVPMWPQAIGHGTNVRDALGTQSLFFSAAVVAAPSSDSVNACTKKPTMTICTEQMPAMPAYSILSEAA